MTIEELMTLLEPRPVEAMSGELERLCHQAIADDAAGLCEEVDNLFEGL